MVQVSINTRRIFLKMVQQKPHQKSWLVFFLLIVSGVIWMELVGSPGLAEENDDFKVIVNASNPISELSMKEIGRIFLKKQEEWPNGFAITVVDQRPDEPARQTFSREILNKDPSAVEAYWSKLIFSGMGIPPIKLASDAEVVVFVSRNVGSIGYVSADTSLGGEVRKLRVTP